MNMHTDQGFTNALEALAGAGPDFLRHMMWDADREQLSDDQREIFAVAAARRREEIDREDAERAARDEAAAAELRRTAPARQAAFARMWGPYWKCDADEARRAQEAAQEGALEA